MSNRDPCLCGGGGSRIPPGLGVINWGVGVGATRFGHGAYGGLSILTMEHTKIKVSLLCSFEPVLNLRKSSKPLSFISSRSFTRKTLLTRYCEIWRCFNLVGYIKT